MGRKKEAGEAVSTEEQSQIQQLLDQYHQIADTLHTSTNQKEVEAGLVALNDLPEAAQIAVMKALGREQNVDAADVLAAVKAVSTSKEVRKEARRSLIRLEGSKIYPQWTPPITRAPAAQIAVANPPRFWKGVVTQTREEGEIQLLLCWEQGYEYSEARMLTFLLDFWHEGVKDVMVDLGGKRRFDERLNDMHTKMPDVSITDCTLAEGRRLIKEALEVNEWRGTPPGRDYRANLPLINQLIFQATDIGKDRGRTFINPELEPSEVIINFLGAWSLGDYGLAYDLLSDDSRIREELERDEWVKRRRNWYNEGHPTRLALGFVHEREQAQSTLWLPSSMYGKHTPSRREIELGWSLELTETPLSGTLPEMPMGTAVNKETGRHWFWTNYIVVRELHEQEVWRIQNITDEGAAVQGLSVVELQNRIKSYEDAIEAKVKQRGTNLNEVAEELSWRLTQLLHFYDALIARLPLDKRVYNDACSRAIVTGNPERTMVYLQRMAERFGEDKADTLRRLGATLVTLSYNYSQPEMHSRQDRLLQRAESTLREAISLEDNALGHILLAEFLLSQERNDEAEQEFLKAKMLGYTSSEEASIEAGLGNIAMRREQIQEALPHFERVAEINPKYPGIWFSIGFAQRLLSRLDAAEESYKRALLTEPEDARPYSELTAIYMNRQQPARARAIMEQGVHTNPNSAELHALYASVLFETGDTRTAQREIEQAEALDPQAELVRKVKQYIQRSRKR
jgi:tetratricopeptide (TPR) repeat protein